MNKEYDPSDMTPRLTPLIEEHFAKLQFNLRLKLTDEAKERRGIDRTDGYIGSKGFVHWPNEACYFTCGPTGETVEFLFNWNVNQCDMVWLVQRDYKPSDFEIVSDLGEM